jgi:hypothetical protein
MRMLSVIVALSLSAAFATAAEADFSFSAIIGIGNGTVAVQKGNVFNGNIVNGRRTRNPTARPRGTRGKHERHRKRGHHGSAPRLHYYPYLYSRHYRGYRVEREPVPAPVPVEVAPPPPIAVAPPPPPDPWGPLRRTPARGIAPIAVPYSLGEALPPDLPHVTLNWRQFDLPEPPPGQLYARVGHDVLLITATGRIVESVVPPG